MIERFLELPWYAEMCFGAFVILALLVVIATEELRAIAVLIAFVIAIIIGVNSCAYITFGDKSGLKSSWLKASPP